VELARRMSEAPEWRAEARRQPLSAECPSPASIYTRPLATRTGSYCGSRTLDDKIPKMIRMAVIG